MSPPDEPRRVPEVPLLREQLFEHPLHLLDAMRGIAEVALLPHDGRTLDLLELAIEAGQPRRRFAHRLVGGEDGAAHRPSLARERERARAVPLHLRRPERLVAPDISV
jgi:hypothetical protein